MWIVRNWGKVAAGATLLLISAYAVAVWHYGELGGKSIYAELQGIEDQHRSVRLADIVALTGSPDIGLVLGVPTDDPMFPNAWIATSTTKPDGSLYVVKTSKAHLRLNCASAHAFFDDPGRVSISRAVREQVERQCTDNPGVNGG
jgi:hypothetical protein